MQVPTNTRDSQKYSTGVKYTHVIRSCASSLNRAVPYVILNAKQNTFGVKKCEANQKQHASRQVRPKALISGEAKKLLYQKYF